MKKGILSTIVMLLMVSAVLAQKPEIFIKDGFAIRGYDAVAYFNSAKPVKGNEQFSLKWRDATWLFSDASNRDAFKADPEKYAPQYGGYCAYGMSRGYKANTEPDAFSIVNGKLYLNYNLDVRSEWNKDQKVYIEKADRNWGEVRKK